MSDLVQPDVRAKLHALRGSLRRRLAFEGLAWTILALVATVFVTLGLDYTLHLDRVPRVVVMLLALAGVGYVVWRQLLAPVAVVMDEEGLALLVERKWQQLGDGLISAIQFSRSGQRAAGTSTAMIERMAQQANQSAADLPFEEIVERRTMRRMLAASLCAVMLLVGLGVLTSPQQTLSLWFQRNVLFRNIDWPQKTYLSVVTAPGENDFTVLRGDDLTITVLVDENSYAPDAVVFHADYRNSVGNTEESVPANADGRSYTMKFAGVSEPFSFYVTGGDDKRDKAHPHEILLVDPPALRDVQYQLEYASYTNLKPSETRAVQGVIVAPIGCTLRLVGLANKDLADASLMLDSEPAGSAQIAQRDRRSFAAQFTVGGENKLSSRMLRVLLKDTLGYSNRAGQQFVIQVQPDGFPSAEMKTQGIGVNITAMARIPLVLSLKDDYGLSGARVGAAVQIKASPPPTTATSAPAVSRTATSMPVRELDEKPLGRREMTAMQVYDLNPPEKDVATSGPTASTARTVNPSMFLKPGDTLTVYAEIDDTMPAYLGGPNRKVVSIDLKIVSPEEVRDDLVRRQKEVADEFTQAIKVQALALAKSSGALAELTNGVSPLDVGANFSESARGQAAVGQECAKAASQLQTILDEMRNNRVFEQDQYDVLANDIIGELVKLAPAIESVSAGLGKANTAIESRRAESASLTSLAEQTVAQQQKILDRMEDIRKAMVKESDRQDLINQVLAQKKTWSEIRGVIGGLIKNAGASIFETKKPAASQPASP